MKPLPAHRTAIGKPEIQERPSVPIVLTHTPVVYASTDSRSPDTNPVPRTYPFLLLASTGVAALFCVLYLTKPVNISAPAAVTPLPIEKATPIPTTASTTSGGNASQIDLLPDAAMLPGESAANPQTDLIEKQSKLPSSPNISKFEETNLRVQHVLTAEATDGQFDRIVLDVPVLYQSRNLRWTSAEVAEARSLLIQMMDYQDQSRALHAKGSELLNTWNLLIERSIPATELRADTPSLPANQQDGADVPRSTGLISSDSIQIHPVSR